MASNSLQELGETYELVFPDHKSPPPMYYSYGLPFTTACTKHVSETFNAERAYIIASTSLSKQTSHVADLEKALGSRHAGTWTGIRPHTYWDDIVPIINDMREKKADLLITIGGCSLTDGAKVIIYALANNVSTLSDMESLLTLSSTDSASSTKYFRDKSHVGNPPTIPIICLPTTLSASEYTRFGGGTSSSTNQKVILTHPRMYPSLIILAPELALTTPEWVWLSTGVRAIDHCVEAFCSLDCPPELQTSSAKSLGLLVPNLLKSKRDPTNLQARLNCHIAAKGSLFGLLWMPGRMFGGASHGIGHQLGPLGVGHGETSCILLPAVCKYNKRVNGTQQEELKRIIWNWDGEMRGMLEGAGLKEGSSDLGDALDVVFRALGMPRSLKEKGITREKFELLAENSLRDPLCVANPIPIVEKEQVLEILETVC